jgi:predicted SAM-dependent methyltransferase
MSDEHAEMPTCRTRLAQYCVGNGLDIGFGGALIVPNAIGVDREEGTPLRRGDPNPSPTHLAGDAGRLYWFKDNVLDFVFSSHCLEDFEDTTTILIEWCRVIKPGGYLVLFLPDEKTYRNLVGEGNKAHKHDDFGLDYLLKCMAKLPEMKVVHSMFPVSNNKYSFDLVARKL